MEAEISTSIAQGFKTGSHGPARLASVRRRQRQQAQVRRRSSSACTPLQLSHSVDSQGLDTNDTSPLYALASLRFLVLSYLADLEHRLTQFEFQFEFQFDFDFDLDLDFESKSKALESWKLQGEHKFREAKARARTAIEMLEGIRADVCFHFPELPMTPSLEDIAKSCLPDMSIPDVPTLDEMRSNLPDIRSHLPDIPTLPDVSLPESVRAHFPDMSLSETVRAHLPDMSIHMHMPTLPDLNIRDFQTGMDDVLSEVRLKFSEIDFRQPFKYIPTLSQSLENLHYHLSSLSSSDLQPPSGVPDLPTFEFTPNSVLSDFLESLMKSDFVNEILDSAHVIQEGERMLELAAVEALKRSLHGMKLINYSDLPHPWRNNPFVTYGYRFIPIEQWPLLFKSLFAWHNETLNIHTHLLPCLFWFACLLPLSTFNSFIYDTPELLFMCFALLCLLSSSIWHTMSGCAHKSGMEFCARIDYVGIGWLISASVATVVHYGFSCYPEMKMAFLGLCLSTGLASSIFPFVKWFNKFEYRYYRISFFVALAFAGLVPIMVLSKLYSPREAISFMSPVFPSLTSYVVGLSFYASHFPERMLPTEMRRRLDMYGCSSHAIWHCFIVLAVYQHKTAMTILRNRLQC